MNLLFATNTLNDLESVYNSWVILIAVIIVIILIAIFVPILYKKAINYDETKQKNEKYITRKEFIITLVIFYFVTTIIHYFLNK